MSSVDGSFCSITHLSFERVKAIGILWENVTKSGGALMLTMINCTVNNEFKGKMFSP